MTKRGVKQTPRFDAILRGEGVPKAMETAGFRHRFGSGVVAFCASESVRRGGSSRIPLRKPIFSQMFGRGRRNPNEASGGRGDPAAPPRTALEEMGASLKKPAANTFPIPMVTSPARAVLVADALPQGKGAFLFKNSGGGPSHTGNAWEDALPMASAAP